jgi:hypothetical protein
MLTWLLVDGDTECFHVERFIYDFVVGSMYMICHEMAVSFRSNSEKNEYVCMITVK